MTGDLVSVIVVNWNGRQYLDGCLAALGAQTHANREIILVDNGSTDGSVEFVAARYPDVRVVRCDYNRGFATANNIGFQHARGSYLATLNNDACADPAWLAELVRGMHTDPDIGMCASKMVLQRDPTIIDSTGIALSKSGIAWDRYGGRRDTVADQEPVEIFGPCAGAALYRRELIDQTGGYDDAFFIYLEDVDLAWRAQRLGWRCLYVPTAKVQHVHSGTTGEGSPFKNYLLGRNKVWMIYKNLPTAHLLTWLPIILAYDFMAVLYSLYRYRSLRSIHGRIAGLRGISEATRQQRRAIQHDARQSARWIKLLEPVEPPWRVANRFSYLHLSPPSAE